MGKYQSGSLGVRTESHTVDSQSVLLQLREGTACKMYQLYLCNNMLKGGGHGGRVVTLSPPTSEAGVQVPVRPQVGKLVVACRWSAVYSTEP